MLSNVKNRARQAAAGTVIELAVKAEQVTGNTDSLDNIKREATHQGSEGLFAGLLADNRAQNAGNAASRAVGLIVGLLVGAIVAAYLLPTAVDELEDVDTSSWSDGAAALWGILGLIIVLSVFLFFVGLALSESGM